MKNGFSSYSAPLSPILPTIFDDFFKVSFSIYKDERWKNEENPYLEIFKSFFLKFLKKVNSLDNFDHFSRYDSCFFFDFQRPKDLEPIQGTCYYQMKYESLTEEIGQSIKILWRGQWIWP